jgi:hypothetical protein
VKRALVLLVVYLRRAFQHGGGVFLPACMSLMTAFLLMFAVHTALPDTESSGTWTESHLLLFRFLEPIGSSTLSNLIQEGTLFQGLSAVSLPEGEAGVAIMGIMPESQAEDFIPVGGQLFQTTVGGSKYFQASGGILPMHLFGNGSEATLSIANSAFRFGGLVSDAYRSVPNRLPPSFAFKLKPGDLVSAALDGEAIKIQDAANRQYVVEKWEHSTPIELPPAQAFEKSGNQWGLPYEKIFISMDDYVSLNIPVLAIYVVTNLPASKAMGPVSALLPEGSWRLEPDFDDFYLTNSRARFARMIERSMGQGIVPFYALLLLSQMAIWGVWLDSYRKSIRSLHILGSSFGQQALSLFLALFLIIITTLCLGGILFVVAYPLMQNSGLLWRFHTQAIALASLAFLSAHSLYFVVWIISTFTELKRTNSK